jgi:class 3 adenylate cyclase
MAAIGRPVVMLAAEVVGYSRLIRADEKGTLEQLETHRDQFEYPKIKEHSGRIVRATGDRLLVEFESPIDAVRCAVELQRGMVDRNLRTLPDQRITFRFGVSADQVTANGNDLVSRAVAALPANILATLIKPSTEFYRERGNRAVRLAGLAEPAGICISDAVQDAIRGQLPYMFADIGKQNLEIGAAPVHCYAVNADFTASSPHLTAQNLQSRPMRLRTAAVAVSVFATLGVCAMALFAWLGANSPTAVIPATVTAGSHVPSVDVTAGGAALASSSRESSPISSTAADIDTQAPPEADRDTQAPRASQPPLASNAAVDGSVRALSSGPALSEIDGVVVRGKQAPTPQTTPDNGAAALSGFQAPAVLQTLPNNGVAVFRGKQEASALQIAADSGAAVVRGNQAPSTPQIAPDTATVVVRGTRVFPEPPLSARPDQR